MLFLQRRSDRDIKIRGLEILVDGDDYFNLNYGQEKQVSLAEGEHEFKASNGLFSVRQFFVIESGKTVSFDVSNVASGFAKFVFMLIGMGPYRVVVKSLD